MTGEQCRKKKHMKTTSQKKSNRLPQESKLSAQAAEQPTSTPQPERVDTRLPIDTEARKQNRTLPTEKVLAMLQQQDRRLWEMAEVVGKWIWVSFSEQPAPQAQAEPAAQPKPDNRLPIDTEARKKNRTLPTEKVLALLQQQDRRLWEMAEVVGKWVWVSFSEQPAPTVRQTLAQLGFHWNRTRQSWQHPCGQFRLSSSGDPREKYPSSHPADMATN